MIVTTYRGKYSHLFIAETSGAGASPATLIAQELELPLIHVRDKLKDHNLGKWVKGKTVVLIEDVIATGASSVSAVQAIRDADGIVNHCFSIFDYGFPKAVAMFKGQIPFSKNGERRLEIPCEMDSIVRYKEISKIGFERLIISVKDREVLEEWSKDPETWSDKYQLLHSTLNQ